jgi:hypothetical protein
MLGPRDHPQTRCCPHGRFVLLHPHFLSFECLLECDRSRQHHRLRLTQRIVPVSPGPDIRPRDAWRCLGSYLCRNQRLVHSFGAGPTSGVFSRGSLCPELDSVERSELTLAAVPDAGPGARDLACFETAVRLARAVAMDAARIVAVAGTAALSVVVGG